MPTPNFFYLIGKPILDKYSRFKGRIIALEFDSDGGLNNIVFVNGGVILSKNKNSVIIDEDKVIIDNPDMIRARKIIDKMDFLKLQLDTIVKIKDMSANETVFSNLLQTLESEFNNVKSDVKNIVRRLEIRKKEIGRRKNRIEHLFYWLNVAKNADGLDNKVYMESFETLDRELVKLNGELEETEYTLLNLSSRLSDMSETLSDYMNKYMSMSQAESDKDSQEAVVDSMEDVDNVQ